MYIVEDPLLALITRFVGGYADVEGSQEELMERQVAAIRAHVEGFPAEERSLRAREWIESHAKQYRQAWQKAVLSEQLRDARCSDCPLTHGDGSRPCPIHDRWLALLNDYVADRLSSAQYVEDTLALLDAHKQHLKVALTRAHPAAHYRKGQRRSA
jgi:hypothetical protein